MSTRERPSIIGGRPWSLGGASTADDLMFLPNPERAPPQVDELPLVRQEFLSCLAPLWRAGSGGELLHAVPPELGHPVVRVPCLAAGAHRRADWRVEPEQ